MIELLFTVCLLTAPDDCSEKRLTFSELRNPMACLTGAQAQLARWNDANPKWRITRWRCQAVTGAHDI